MATSRIYDIQAQADPVLTSIVRGYGNNSFIADQILPIAPVDSLTGTYRDHGADRFIVEESLRALRANSNRVPAGTTVRLPYTLDEYDLEEPIDYLEGKTDVRRETNAANRVQEKLTLGREKRVADLVQTAGTYAGGHSAALSGSSRWSHADSDPIAAVAAGKVTVSSKIGTDPNTLVLAHDVYSRLINHPALIEKIKYSGVGVLNVDLLKQLFDIQNIIIGRGVYKASKDADFTKLYSNTAALLYVNDAPVPDEENPSFGYTLRLKGFPFSDKRQENGNKLTIVRSTDVNKSLIMQNTAGYLFTSVLS